jgi:tetratricopeptide (TPR) repeat protein
MGDVHAARAEIEKATASYRKALEIRPDYAVVHYKLGRLLEETDPAGAIKHFENYQQSGKNLQYSDDVQQRLESLREKQKSK